MPTNEAGAASIEASSKAARSRAARTWKASFVQRREGIGTSGNQRIVNYSSAGKAEMIVTSVNRVRKNRRQKWIPKA